MSRATPTELELLRLTRLLDVDTVRLAPLADLPLGDLKALREQAAGRLFDEGEDAFRRAAHVANLVPAALAAIAAGRTPATGVIVPSSDNSPRTT